MARGGYKFFDSDAHVGPYVDVLEPYLTAEDKTRLLAWEQFKSVSKNGYISYNKGQRTYRRQLHSETADASPAGYMAGFTGVKRSRPISTDVDRSSAARIADMDFEGADANLMLPSGWFGTFTSGDDVALETGMYRAFHRWMHDYCAPYSDRLGGVVLVSSRDIEGSIKEMRRAGKEKWAWGVLLYAPYGTPIDLPSLDPIWAEAQELDLSAVLHTFTVMPPYAPGGLDTWDNLWLQRSAAHPWCGMRNMAALIGSGLLDRFPRLRLGCLEAGHGWLPFWMARLDEHMETIRAALPEGLKHHMSEYVMSGRYYQSIETSEGEKVTNMVADIVGEDVLMYASDYPPGESPFPEGTNTVLGWKSMSETRKRKLFWDNAVRFYARSGLG
jgi:predicted TIM-barrel fold metal-dependent hydrolase